LVRIFLDNYGLNLLKAPRAGAEVGDLYIKDEHGIASGSLSHFLETIPTDETRPSPWTAARFTLPPVKRNLPMASVHGTLSDAIDAKIGLDFLGGFFEALGAADLKGKLGAAYRDKGASVLKFEIDDATRDSLDPILLGSRLLRARPVEGHPFGTPGNRFFVATAVARSKEITVRAEKDRASGVTVDLGVDDLLKYRGKVTATRREKGAITFKGQSPLAFGVELIELTWDEQGKLQMKTTGAVAVRHAGEPPTLVEPTFLMGPTEEAFVRVRSLS
jgi:hypothetical protein